MDNSTDSQLIETLRNLPTHQFADLMKKVKLERRTIRQQKRLAKQEKQRKYRLSKNKISSLMSREMGFRSKKAFLDYIKTNNIELSNFQNIHDFYTYIKNKRLSDDNIQLLNSVKKFMKEKEELINQAVEIFGKKQPYLEPLPAKPITGGEYWSFNLPEDPDQYPDILQMVKETRNMYGSSNVNKNLKTIYNNNITGHKDIIDTIYELHKKMNTMYRLLFSFGCVYETHHKERDENNTIIKEYYTYSVYTPATNKYFLEENVIIKNKRDLKSKVLAHLTAENIKDQLEYVESGTKLIGIFSMMLKVTLLDFPIGSQIKLPDYIKSSMSIISLEGIEHNLCYWACLALADGARRDRYLQKAQMLFREYYGPKKSIEKYVGFDFHKELDKYEEFNQKYAINILSYNEDKSAILIRHSEFNDTRTPIYLNLYMDHFSYITNKDKLIKMYMCHTCAKSFRDNVTLDRHQKICTKEQQDVFVKYPQIYEPKRNTIIELAEWFGVDVDFKYDYLIVYDLEADLLKVTEDHGAKTKITHKHVPMSFSVYDNIPGYSQEYFYDSPDPVKLVENFFLRLDKLCEEATSLMLKKMQPLIEAIEGYYHEKRRERYLKQVKDYCSTVPIVGYNSGFYDTGIMINYNFMQEILKRDKNPMVIKTGNRYKVIKAGSLLFLDQSLYLAAGTSLSQFITAFDAGENKGFFPYEFLDSYDKLDLPYTVLKREHFDSKLRSRKMTQQDYAWVMNTGKKLGWETIRDLLRWYNNLDVRPFLKACLKNKMFYYPLNLDMYKDGFSLPQLSEKIMFSYMLQGFEEYKDDTIKPSKDYTMPNNIIDKRANYKIQDKKVKRNLENYITVEQIEKLIAVQSFKCYYCHRCLDNDQWSLDRIECDKAHIENNCVIACLNCNKQRKDELFQKFNRKKALLRFAREKSDDGKLKHPMIYLIDEDNKEVFYKLKQNITGGASLVFHRYHEAEKTELTRTHYDSEKKEWFYDKNGKKVRKIVGYDANALYLWCIGQIMLCGRLKWIETSDFQYIINALKGKFFGFLEVDIHVPENKYEYFSQMCPIFKNLEYSQEEAGEHMKEIIKLNQENPDKVKYTKNRKLIASLKGTKLLIKSDRLKWMIEHGCIVDKIYGVIPAVPGRPFKGFMDKVSEERRNGDKNPKYKVIGDMWKTVGNSAFGRTAMNKNKHNSVKYCNEIQFNRKKYDYFYYDANVYNDVYEVYCHKKYVKQNIPIQVACSIYDDSKKRMLEFCYDCVDKYLDRSDYQYMEMDTDSAYIALTGDFEELVKPELKEDFYKNYHKWFPRRDTPENAARDMRTPGLFKVEFEGIGMVALCSKMYFVLGNDKNKFSCKGMQHSNNQNILNFETYKQVLFSGLHNTCTNRGFRFINKEIVTYEVSKSGLTSVYDKGVVMDDWNHIRPLDI